jgi:hypothetical protein
MAFVLVVGFYCNFFLFFFFLNIRLFLGVAYKGFSF